MAKGEMLMMQEKIKQKTKEDQVKDPMEIYVQNFKQVAEMNRNDGTGQIIYSKLAEKLKMKIQKEIEQTNLANSTLTTVSQKKPIVLGSD